MKREKNKLQITYEIYFLLFIVILAIVSLFLDLITKIYILYLIISLFALIFWRIAQKWSRLNQDQLPGKIFEYLFFLSLFIATYTLTFIVAFIGNPEKIIDQFFLLQGFILSLISAAFCGWLYYVEGIFNKKYYKPKTKKQK